MTRDGERKVGYLFGSFNPIHVGHLMVAEFMATRTDLDHVVLVVSPHNPLKDKLELAPEQHRLEMCKIAVGGNEALSVSDVEFGMPQPSYTIDTLNVLREKMPSERACLIMGSDNLAILNRWKNWEELLRDYDVYAYERPGHPVDKESFPSVKRFTPPLIEVSSTYIRNCIRSGLSTRYLIPDTVRDYISTHNLYA